MERQPVYKHLAVVLCLLILSSCATISRGNFGAFKRSLNNKPHGYSVEEDVTGSAPKELIEVFEVRPGDCGRSDDWSDCKNDRERSELSQAEKDNLAGDEYWYGWEIYFPEDYTNIYPTKVALGQFHQKSSHPVWMFQNSNGGYHLDDQVLGSTSRYHTLITQEDLLGKWHKVEVHVIWSTKEDGLFEVWVNNEKKVTHKGKTMSAKQVYFKYGIYRSFMKRYKNKFNETEVPGQTVYFSNVKRAKNRDGLKP